MQKKELYTKQISASYIALLLFSNGHSQSIPAALLTGPSFATCRIIRNPPASGSRLMICHNRMLLRNLSGVACTTPDTSKSQPTAYCFVQLKHGTCLIRLKQCLHALISLIIFSDSCFRRLSQFLRFFPF